MSAESETASYMELSAESESASHMEMSAEAKIASLADSVAASHMELLDEQFASFKLEHAELALRELIGPVRAVDVRAPLQTPHCNVGEMLALSIEAILLCVGGMDKSDIFFDIGAGLGNVFVQVSLQTNAAQCVGIEVRPDVLRIGKQRIQKHTQSYPQLHQFNSCVPTFETSC